MIAVAMVPIIAIVMASTRFGFRVDVLGHDASALGAKELPSNKVMFGVLGLVGDPSARLAAMTSAGPLVNRTIVQNAFVVNDIEAAMQRWTRVFGVGPWFYNPDVSGLADPRYRGAPTELRFAGALAQAGSVQIELIQALNDVPSCYRDLYPKGIEGPHHIAIFAEDFDAECARYAAEGFEVAFSGANRDMRFAYYDTSAVLGVMVEILEDVPSVREAFGRIKAAGDSWDGTNPILGSAQKLS